LPIWRYARGWRWGKCLNWLILMPIGLSLDVPLSGCLVELSIRNCSGRLRQVGLGRLGLLSIRSA
jgi:hypothetical protein